MERRYYLNSPKIRKLAFSNLSGSGVGNLNVGTVRKFSIFLPDLATQKALVKKLESFSKQSEDLIQFYQQKIDAFDELKQSLLHQSFTGQLIRNTVIAFPEHQQTGLVTTSPEFTANIIAHGFWMHQTHGRQRTYGHVKAQKHLHLAESIAGIDLGREPIKDSAGPNDFPHMLKAEKWAKGQQFFEFVRNESGKGYDFKPLANFDKCLANAQEVLSPYEAQLEEVLKLIMPLATLEAEVLATVHAAWNNLMILGEEISDENIVLAARDDWHEEKLNIPPELFFDAIKQIRQKNVIPNGSGKLVRALEKVK